MLQNKRLFLKKKSSNIICHQHQLVFFVEISEIQMQQHLKNPEARSGTLCGGPRNFIAVCCVASKPTFQTQVQGEDKQPEEQAQWRIFMDFTDCMVVVMKYFKAITVSWYDLYCKQHMNAFCLQMRSRSWLVESGRYRCWLLAPSVERRTKATQNRNLMLILQKRPQPKEVSVGKSRFLKTSHGVQEEK